MKSKKKKTSNKRFNVASESHCSLCGQQAFVKEIHNGANVYWPIKWDKDEFEQLSPPEIMQRKRDHAET